MNRPMPGPPECYDIDWDPTWGMVYVNFPPELGHTVSHAELDKKRLTVVECAREYGRVLFDAEYKTPHGYERQAAIVRTWHRFVTRPHTLEES